MKRFHFVAGLFVVAGLSLQAQTIDLRANIPFDFQLAGKSMPAGEYVLHHSRDLLLIHEEGGSHAGALSLTVRHSRPEKARHGELLFNRYGDVYYLEQLWQTGLDEGRVVPRSASERQLARSHQVPGVVAVRTK